MGHVFIFLTVIFTVYGLLIIKHQVTGLIYPGIVDTQIGRMREEVHVSKLLRRIFTILQETDAVRLVLGY